MVARILGTTRSAFSIRSRHVSLRCSCWAIVRIMSMCCWISPAMSVPLRGVRRNGTLIAGDIQQHIDMIRTIAQQEHLSETCLDRIEKAERVVPKMRATIEFVSSYVRQQVRQLDLTPPQSYAMHAHLIPSSDLERVAATRTPTEG